MNEQMNMNISGSSSMPGGEYDRVSISGAGTVEGNLSCAQLHCSGAAKVHGDVRCTGEIRTSGAADIAGSVQCERLSSSGAFIVDGGLRVQARASASGSVDVGAQLTADEVSSSGCLKSKSVHCRSFSCSGSCKIAGDLEAENASLSGGAEIGGLLNAESVTISPSRSVHINAIGGGRISVISRDVTSFFGLFHSHPGCAQIHSIEGDEIELEFVEAEIVRGRNIRIGTGCKISRVEYSGTLTAEPGTVAAQVHTGTEIV